MRLFHMATVCIFAALCSFADFRSAYCEEFQPIHIEPSVNVFDGVASVKLYASYYGSNRIASHQKLSVKVQSLGNLLPMKNDMMGLGVPVVTEYDENVAPVVVSTEVETDENGQAELEAQLNQGNYQIVISYDGIENTGWKPLRIPVSNSDTSLPCRIYYDVKTKNDRKIYRTGEEIPIHFTATTSSFFCSDDQIKQYYVEFNDGVNRNLVKVDARNPNITYKSKRIGIFPVSLRISFDNPDEKVPDRPEYTITHSTPSLVSIVLSRNLLSGEFVDDEFIYYFENELVKPEPQIENNYFNTIIRYEAVSDELEHVLSLAYVSKLTLHLYKEDGTFITVRQTAAYPGDGVKFVIPHNLSGTITPILYINDDAFVQLLPSFVVKTDYFMVLATGGGIVLIVLSVYFIRKRRIKSRIPSIPSDEQINDIEKCRDYIRLCYAIVSKKRVGTVIDWRTDTIETYFESVVSSSGINDQSFERYSFSINAKLQQKSYTKEDLINIRNQSLDLLM